MASLVPLILKKRDVEVCCVRFSLRSLRVIARSRGGQSSRLSLALSEPKRSKPSASCDTRFLGAHTNADVIIFAYRTADNSLIAHSAASQPSCFNSSIIRALAQRLCALSRKPVAPFDPPSPGAFVGRSEATLSCFQFFFSLSLSGSRWKVRAV